MLIGIGTIAGHFLNSIKRANRESVFRSLLFVTWTKVIVSGGVVLSAKSIFHRFLFFLPFIHAQHTSAANVAAMQSGNGLYVRFTWRLLTVAFCVARWKVRKSLHSIGKLLARRMLFYDWIGSFVTIRSWHASFRSQHPVNVSRWRSERVAVRFLWITNWQIPMTEMTCSTRCLMMNFISPWWTQTPNIGLHECLVMRILSCFLGKAG